MTDQEKHRKFAKRIRNAVMKADYEKAFKLTEDALRLFSNVPFAVLDHC